jgi:glyoxylase-like metal-dependent hydrolase (beta-lactamase superfamily II)
MASNHSMHALMVGMSESWWRAGIMPCVRSDVERDKPVAYIMWLIEGTGFDYFPNARFILQQAELEFWTGPLMRHEILNRQIRPKVRPALERLKEQGRIELIDGDFELYPGLDLLKAGGHTPGSQMVALQTDLGKAVLCGDIAYTFRNVRDYIPVGWYYHLGETAAALDRALATVSHPDLAFPNHDTEIMQGRRVTRVV